jgi:phosphoesterase RecJ-like protein
MSQKQQFLKEFNTLDYILRNAKKVFIVAHSNPDPDAVGSTVALGFFVQKHYSAKVIMGCYDPFPSNLKELIPGVDFINPQSLDLSKFDVVIGCDSAERGFNKVVEKVEEDCVTVAIDHHHDIALKTDLSIIDGICAATCEILYDFFIFTHKKIDKNIATALLIGIIGDTGAYQHANTSADVLTMSADLIKQGASVTKIINTLSANRDIETLNLWGRALERTKFYQDTGLAVSAITKEDLRGYSVNSGEISNIASMLATVPSVRAALVIYQADDTTIKGSLRAEKHGNIDVSAIAHTLGGGGHKLASGFSLPGQIVVEKNGGWKII